MLRPPNVVNVYPLTAEQPIVGLSPDWTGTVVVFNAEAERADDIMHNAQTQIDLRIQIADLINLGIPVVVITRGPQVEQLQARFPSEKLLKIIQHKEPKIVHSASLLLYVGTCSQRNIL